MVRHRYWIISALCASMFLPATPAIAKSSAPLGPQEIVGGHRARPGEFPWAVHLSVGCGGSLYSRRIVLTAAHCVPASGQNSSIEVTFGIDRRNPADRIRSAQIYRAADFTHVTTGDDWALIKLSRPAFGPTLSIVTDGNNDRGQFTVVGWGRTSEGGAGSTLLRKVGVPFVDDLSCGQTYRRAGYNFTPEEMICAGRGGKDSCQGDSGGPLVRRDNGGYWRQVGIVSWGEGCARDRYPGVYTQISRFSPDIKHAAAELEREDPPW